jgi:opacity protein-like surface antigen
MATMESSSQPFPPLLFNQTRVGFGLSGEYINAGANLKVDPRGRLPQGIASSQSHLEKSFQIAPCIELGSLLADNYYLGLHASWRFSGIANKSKTPTTLLVYFLHEFKLNYYTDILLKAGYKLTPRTMLYGLIGPTFAKWSHTTDFYDGDNVLLNRSIRIDKKSLGLGVGFGFEYLKEKYAFSFDYVHHFHKSVSQDQNMTIRNGVGQLRSGNLIKKVQPSYGVLAARFTIFFNL